MTESPLMVLTELLASVPLEELRTHIAAQPSEESTCGTCREPIRSTPSIHQDGSVHWASGGWEHIATEDSACGSEYPYKWAKP